MYPNCVVELRCYLNMPRPVLKQNIFSLNFQSITVSQAEVSSCNDTLHCSKLNSRFVLLEIHYEIKKIKMSENKNVLDTKLCMFSDDTQLFNKNEGSVEQA